MSSGAPPVEPTTADDTAPQLTVPGLGWPVPPRRRGSAGRLARLDVLFPALVLAAVVLGTATGLSGSSLPALSPTGTPATQYVKAGHVRTIRIDEWNGLSPIRVGLAQRDNPATRTFGMGSVPVRTSWLQRFPSPSLGAALYAPYNLPFLVLPLASAFALSWWLSFAACWLGLYAWLRAMRVEPAPALLGAVLVGTAPAIVWWTGVGSQLGQIIGGASIACALVVASTRLAPRRPYVALLVALLAGLSAASAVGFYAPWVIGVDVFVAGVTILWGVHLRAWRGWFLAMAAMATAVFAVATVVYLLHEHTYYQALAATVYPGQRKASGGGVGLGIVFASLFPEPIASHGARLKTSNLSEVAMGWTVASVAAVALVLVAYRRLRRGERLLMVGAVALMVVLASWCFVSWPQPLATLLDRIPPARMAPLIGFMGVVCCTLLLGTRERRERVTGSLGIAGAVAVTLVVTGVAAWGASAFQAKYLPLATGWTVLSVAVVALVTASLWTAARGIVFSIVAAAALLSAAVVNPLTDATAVLERSAAARTVRALDARIVAPQHGTWAGDGLLIDGLLNGEGVDSLSSFNDPVDRRGWEVLDPGGRFQHAWNRLGYIVFEWQPGLRAPQFGTLGQDIVVVIVDPCNARLDRLRLRGVMSARPLTAPCLTLQGRFGWAGGTYYAYARAPSSG